MKILIIGGTLFLGRHLVEAALAGGHKVTLFNRGTTNPGLFPDVEHLHGDRDTDLAALSGRSWDAAIDTCGYVPRIVQKSAEFLARAIGLYVYVSSASVYADLNRDRIDESAPLNTLDDATTENVAENYGALKAMCEGAVQSTMPGRALIARAGLLVGPYDQTERFMYWVQRVKAGGEVLAPGKPGRRIQLIHARDMADWIVRMIESNRIGIYNVAGPASPLTMGELLEACRQATGSDAAFTWVAEAFLGERKVAPFSEMPLWLPEDSNGLLSLDLAKAIADGLSFRTLAETIADTMAWDKQRLLSGGMKPARLASGAATHAGISREREREFLNAWHTRPGVAARA
ncbi:MAG: SDR family oxidoreductase [Burkholderiaceae bacterium]